MNPSRKLSWLTILIAPFLAIAAHAATLSPTSLTLLTGGSSTISVTSIKGTPSLSNSNPGVASAKFVDSKIVVTALATGSTTLSVRDASGTKSAKVTVIPPMSVSPGSASLLVGKSVQFTVSNAYGSIRLRNSDTDVFNTSLSNNIITVTGKRQGTAFLTVSDNKSQVVVQVNVTATTPPPSTSGSTSGRLLASNCFQCHGTNGSGGFDRLAGSSELLQELREFSNGQEDAGGIMAAHAMGYTDAQLQAIADYLANQ